MQKGSSSQMQRKRYSANLSSLIEKEQSVCEQSTHLSPSENRVVQQIIIPQNSFSGINGSQLQTRHSPMMRNNAEQAVRVKQLKFILKDLGQGQDFLGPPSPHLNTSNPDEVDQQIKRKH